MTRLICQCLLCNSRGEKNFICDYEDCGQVFYTAQQLEVHQRTHNNNKPFTCSYCSRPFTTAGNLKNHMRCHTGLFTDCLVISDTILTREKMKGKYVPYCKSLYFYVTYSRRLKSTIPNIFII